MSTYLARLKQFEDGKNYHYTPDTVPSKPSKVPFEPFEGTPPAHIEKIIVNDANADDTLLADYDELTACIIELCQLAGYADDARDRMLEARRYLYPFQYSTECAYFRLQVIRAMAGAYWHDDILRS